MSRKILIVEDDAAAAAYLAKGLGEAGYAVETTHDGRDGLFLASEGTFDVLIVDRMLPGIDGLAMIAAARAAGIDAPAIMLSALGTVDDRIGGLKAGADDYLPKPFEPLELVARVEVLARRAQAVTPGKPSELILDPARHSMTCDGREVMLTPTEFRMLAAISSRPGEVVRRRAIAAAAWPSGGYVSDNTIDAYIVRLRNKMRSVETRKQLTTVRGVGYALR